MNESVKRWFNDKELFLRELAKGRKWEAHVATMLTELGYEVDVPDCGDYEMANDPAYKNSHDMLVNGHIVEVKSRNLDFTTPDSFPYPTIFVKSKSSYDKLDDKPVMCVTVSQKSGNVLALDVQKTYKQWSPVRFWDRVRKIHTTAYECEKGLWEDIAVCAKRLLKGVPTASGN